MMKAKKPTADALRNAKRGDRVTGLFVGREEPGGIVWVAWDEASFRELCDAFDDARARRRKAPAARASRKEPADAVTAGVILKAGAELLRRHAGDKQPYAVTFGGEKVFIFPLWEEIHKRYDISLEAFKTLLLSLLRAGELSLSRADLVEVMDRRAVERSAIRHWGSEWNFLRVTRN